MAKQGAKTVVPTLRFPEFRETSGWVEAPLGEQAVFHKGRGISKADLDVNGALSCIRYGELYTRYGEVIDSVFSKTSVPVTELFLSRKYDVIIPASGETKEDIATASCVLLDDVALGSDLNVIRSSHNGIFLSYFLNGAKRREIARVAQGNAVVHLYPSQIGALHVSFPEEAEQQRIADCLTSLDEVIAAQVRKVESLKTHKRGLMQQLFPRGGGVRPHLRFPEFHNAPDWTLGKASDIVNVMQGYGFPERLQGSRDGDFPFYKVSDISTCVDAGGILLDKANNHIDASVLEELRAKLMPVGSTVFAKIGEAIRSNRRAITSRLCLVDNNAAGVKAIAGSAYDRFVYYLWCQVPLIEYAGGVVPAVNKSAIEQIPVCYPKIDEQRRIADFLSSLDVRIAAEAEQLAGLKTHKQGLMSRLFPMSVGG